MNNLPKIFIITGIVLIVIGILVKYGLLCWVGHLPGDINIKKENIQFIFPITTCITLSLIFWIILCIFRKLL